MNMNERTNSQEYWEHRFETDWESHSGREQTRFFCRLAVEHFPDWLSHAIRQHKLSLCDWGCAEGDGTDVLAQFLGAPSITGVDFSETAIAKARQYYPRLNFLATNFLESMNEQEFDALFSSNTFEHFSEPWDIFAKLARHIKKFMILLVPYREFVRHMEHEYSFVSQNILLSPCEDWALVYSRVFDTGRLQPSYWPGEQILLIFARAQIIAQLSLTLDNAYLNENREIEQIIRAESGATVLGEALQAALAAREAALSVRDMLLAERDEARHQQEVALAARDVLLAERDEARHQQEVALAARDVLLAERDEARHQQEVALAARDVLLAERDEARRQQEVALAARDVLLAERDEARRQQEVALAQHALLLAEQDATLASRDTMLAERDAALRERDQYLQMYNAICSSRVWRIAAPCRRLIGRLRLVRRKVYTAMHLLRRRQWKEMQDRVATLVKKHLPCSKAQGLHITNQANATHDDMQVVTAFPRSADQSTLRVMMLVEHCYDTGIEREIIDLCCELCKTGIAVEIAVAGAGGRFYAASAASGISVVEFEHDEARFVAHVTQVQPAILITHCCYFALQKIVELGIPVVEVLHSAYFWQNADEFIHSIRTQCVTHYIAVSEYVRDFSITHFDLVNSNITIIHNGINPIGLLRPPMQRVALQRLHTIFQPVIVHVANGCPAKNHRLVIAAFRRIQQEFPQAKLQLIVACDVNTQWRDTLLQELARDHLHDKVCIIGAANRRQLSFLLTNAHIAILPSSLEGFSMAALEYTYFGLPSVLSQTGAAEYLLDRFGHGVLVKSAAISPEQLSAEVVEHYSSCTLPEAVDETASAVLDILRNYAYYCQRGLEASQRYPEYSIASGSRQYLTLLQEKFGRFKSVETSTYAAR